MIDTEWYKITKDIIQATAWIGTVVATVFTALKILVEIRNNRQQRQDELKQRKEELRWRQANLAKEIMDNMYKETYAINAMKMLESTQREYEISKGKFKQINFKDVLNAISHSEPTEIQNETELEQYEKQRFIRDSFDHFFAVMYDLEHYIDIGLIKAEDTKCPFNYYATKIKPYRQIFEQYMKEEQPEESLVFLQRFLPNTDNRITYQ